MKSDEEEASECVDACGCAGACVRAFLWVFGVNERGCGWECVKERKRS